MLPLLRLIQLSLPPGMMEGTYHAVVVVGVDPVLADGRMVIVCLWLRRLSSWCGFAGVFHES